MTQPQQEDHLLKELSEEKKKKIDEAVERKMKEITIDQNLERDECKINGQNYALISVVSPNSNQKSDQLCIKIKGVFKTLEEANKHAEQLQKLDDMFDIYVVEMYSWLLLPPDPTQMEQKHVDQKLNDIIGGHRKEQMKAKAHFEERKKELMQNIDIENEERKEKNKLQDITIDDSDNKEESVTTTRESLPEQSLPEQSLSVPTPVPTPVPPPPTPVPSEQLAANDCPSSGPVSEASIDETGVKASNLMNSMVNDDLTVNPRKAFEENA
jgi:hypothetical protein